MSINDAHLQAPITSQEAIDWGDFSLRLRVELYAFAKAGTLLSILQSKARRTLKIKLKKRTPS